MSTTTTTVDIEAPPTPVARPYARSWVNVLNDAIERLPGPSWVAYLALMVVWSLLSLAFAAADPAGSVSPFGAVYYGVLPFAILYLIGHLDATARRALAGLRPLLAIDDAEKRLVEYRLSTVPARHGAAILVVIAIMTPISYALDPVGTGVSTLPPVALVARFVAETFTGAVMLVLVVHTLRQLRAFDGLHDRLVRVDLFDQAPLHGASWVSSRTAIGLLLLLVPSALVLPADMNAVSVATNLGWYGFAVLFAALAFVLPVRGVHGLLAQEKRRLQAEVGRRLSATLGDIHAAVDAKDEATIAARQQAMATLIAERELVAKVPTWPWSTGALTGFVSAVLLPIVLFVVTRALERLV